MSKSEKTGDQSLLHGKSDETTGVIAMPNLSNEDFEARSPLRVPSQSQKSENPNLSASPDSSHKRNKS